MKHLLQKLIICLLAFSNFGCAVFNVQDNTITQEKRVKIIFDSSKAGAFAALSSLEDNSLNVAIRTVSIIEEFVDPILQSEDTILHSSVQLAMNYIPEEYEIYLAPAISTFDAYYEPPSLDEAIGSEQLELVVALFEGVRQAANKVIVDAAIVGEDSNE